MLSTNARLSCCCLALLLATSILQAPLPAQEITVQKPTVATGSHLIAPGTVDLQFHRPLEFLQPELKPLSVPCYTSLLWESRFDSDFEFHYRWAWQQKKNGDRHLLVSRLNQNIDEVIRCLSKEVEKGANLEAITRAWAVIYGNMSVGLVEYIARYNLADDLGLSETQASTNFLEHYQWAEDAPLSRSARELKAKVSKVIGSEKLGFVDWLYARSMMEMVMKLSMGR